MARSQLKEKCSSELHMYEWYRDNRGRVWVITGFWYENEEKAVVYLLQMGTKTINEQPYSVVKQSVDDGKMIPILANI